MSLDPQDDNFLKSQIGKTKVDPGAGVTQPVKLFLKGAEDIYHFLQGENYDGKTPFAANVDFGASRLNPVPSFLAALMRGRDFDSQPYETKKAIINRMTPIVIQDLTELYQENPELLWLAVPAVFGEGVNTYTR